MSNDTEPRRGRPVPWLGIASLLVTVARFLVELWRKGCARRVGQLMMLTAREMTSASRMNPLSAW